jgi:hypothetical protein
MPSANSARTRRSAPCSPSKYRTRPLVTRRSRPTASSVAILIASGRPAAMGQLFQACTGMSGYSRRGRGASGPPMGTSKHCRAGATTGDNAPLCPPAAPALGRVFGGRWLGFPAAARNAKMVVQAGKYDRTRQPPAKSRPPLSSIILLVSAKYSILFLSCKRSSLSAPLLL